MSAWQIGLVVVGVLLVVAAVWAEFKGPRTSRRSQSGAGDGDSVQSTMRDAGGSLGPDPDSWTH